MLINNAGVSLIGIPYYETVDKVEATFASNHLGHFLFTLLILPRIRAAVTPSFSPRITNVASDGHTYFPFKIDNFASNFEGGKTWDHFLAYAHSKSANILFSLELAKRLHDEGILSYSLHPGRECIYPSSPTVTDSASCFHMLLRIVIWTQILETKSQQDLIDFGKSQSGFKFGLSSSSSTICCLYMVVRRFQGQRWKPAGNIRPV